MEIHGLGPRLRCVFPFGAHHQTPMVCTALAPPPLVRVHTTVEGHGSSRSVWHCVAVVA